MNIPSASPQDHYMQEVIKLTCASCVQISGCNRPSSMYCSVVVTLVDSRMGWTLGMKLLLSSSNDCGTHSSNWVANWWWPTDDSFKALIKSPFSRLINNHNFKVSQRYSQAWYWLLMASKSSEQTPRAKPKSYHLARTGYSLLSNSPKSVFESLIAESIEIDYQGNPLQLNWKIVYRLKVTYFLQVLMFIFLRIGPKPQYPPI